MKVKYSSLSAVSIVFSITLALWLRVVKSRLTDHLVSNGLHSSQSSPVCLLQAYHSTVTALRYIHDHLINAIGSQKLSCLCLLGLSAAFDTIDHNILITRLSSWFGIHGSFLNRFKSYLNLTSRSFRVKCDKDFSSEHISSCGVPQGSVIGSGLPQLMHVDLHWLDVPERVISTNSIATMVYNSTVSMARLLRT